MGTTVFETYLSPQDARLNNVVKQLTACAAIIAVPTAINGILRSKRALSRYGAWATVGYLPLWVTGCGR
jgi:hypothetical protein